MKSTIWHILVLSLLMFGCRHKRTTETAFSKSTVHIQSFQSEQESAPRAYRVYYPENYSKDNSYPILYLLHGHGGSDDDWFSQEEGHVQYLLDSLISKDLIPPLIAVSLDAANSWYIDRYTNMEAIYVDEFIPFFEQSLDANIHRSNRFIIGNSAGGYGALRFSLKYPEFFNSSILLSPAAYYPSPPMNSSSRKIDLYLDRGVFSDSIWQAFSYIALLEKGLAIDELPKFYISTGDDDRYQIVDVVDELKSKFDSLGIEHEVSKVDGGHDWDVWRECFAVDVQRFFSTED